MALWVDESRNEGRQPVAFSLGLPTASEGQVLSITAREGNFSYDGQSHTIILAVNDGTTCRTQWDGRPQGNPRVLSHATIQAD
jgi:hypothetical protein